MSTPLGHRSDKDVGKRVIKGAAMLVSAKIVLRCFSFINLIVLARLLKPQDYGIAALAMSAIVLMQTLSDVRVGSAIVNMRDITAEHLHTGFTISVIRGLVMAAGLLFGAELFAHFSRSPDLVAPIRVLSIVPIMDSLANPKFILFQRQINFKPEFRRALVSNALGSIAAIAAALYFKSYWAIIFGTVISRSTQTVMTYVGVPAQVGFSLNHWRAFLSFGSWLTLAGMLEYVRTSFGPSLLFGRYLGSASLGIFSIANTLSALVTTELSIPLQQAIAPGLAAIVHDPERMRKAFREAQVTVFGIVFPAGVGLAALSRDLIVLLAGAKWEGAAPLVQILAPAMAIGMLNVGVSALLMAMQKTRLFFQRSLATAVAGVPPIFAAAAFGDVRWATAAVALNLLFATAITLRLAGRLTESPALEPVYRSWRTVAAALVMAAGLGVVGPSSETATLSLLAAVLPKLALGVVLYTGTLLLLWRVTGRPSGFETKIMDLLGPRLPSWLRPAYNALRYPARRSVLG